LTYNKTSAWEPTLRKYALLVFRWLLILEVCFLGIKAALNRDQLADIFKQFVMLLLMAGFFWAVIDRYKEWTWNLINGLKAIGLELSSGQYSSDAPFITGMKLVKLILDKLSAWSPGNSIALLIAALVVIVCFALISAQVVFIKCEAMIAMMASLILVGFGGSSFLKDYAVNAMRYALSVAFKLFVMQLVLGVGISFIEGFDTSAAELQDIFVVIGAAVVLLALVKSLPDACSGIINGSHVSSGSALTSAAAAVGGAVLGAAIAGSNTVQNVKDAANVAGMEGKTGFGKAAHMAQTLWGARQDAKTAGEKALSTRTRSEMQERLEQARMKQN
jgi:type IV secretion system protein TrbL